MPNMNDITKLPYVEWLESTLREVTSLPVESICVVTKIKGGAIYASYSDGVSMNDKILYAGRIQQDAMLDMMGANGLVKNEDEDNTD